MNTRLTTRADILVVTALAKERDAVRTHLRETEISRSGSTTADIGIFEGEFGEVEVAIVETGPGNVEASTSTLAALRDLGPKTVVLVGIAGGIKDVCIGDVVAASKVYWVESEKHTAINNAQGTIRSCVLPRPSVGMPSNRLVQTAKGVAADGAWRRRGSSGNALRLDGELAHALVSPLASGEKVVADGKSAVAAAIRRSYSDAVAVAMEDYGAMRAAETDEAVASITIRGVSDLLDDKSRTDELGAQELAAANASAFAFELIAMDIGLSQGVAPTKANPIELIEIAATLYPGGPTDRSVWQRAGGDLSRISLDGDGHSRWWLALEQLALGGGGKTISIESLLCVMIEDYPHSVELRSFAANSELN